MERRKRKRNVKGNQIPLKQRKKKRMVKRERKSRKKLKFLLQRRRKRRGRAYWNLKTKSLIDVMKTNTTYCLITFLRRTLLCIISGAAALRALCHIKVAARNRVVN